MLCRVIPYESDEPYIFVSYCNEDAEQVYPLLEQMTRDGYRIWYDDGSCQGEERVMKSAKRWDGCTLFLTMLSHNSALLHNCRNEMNCTIEYGKKMLAVLLEDFAMPLGLKRQISMIHSLKKKEYSSQYTLLSKVYEVEGIAGCKVNGRVLPMREVPEAISSLTKEEKISKAVDAFVAAKNIVEKKPEVPAENKAEQKAEVPKEKKEHQQAAPIRNLDDEKTITQSTLMREDEEDAPTMHIKQQETSVLVRLKGGKAYRISSALTRIGRSEKRCEIVLKDNPYIGNCHAEILQFQGEYHLRDLKSTNGTFINGTKLEEKDRVLLENGGKFQLHDEWFVFFSGEQARKLLESESTFFLKNMDTQEMKLLLEDCIWLDRGHAWKGGTLNELKISRSYKHAVINIQDNTLWLQDKGSTNGTYLNENKVKADESQQIKVLDKIRLGDTTLEVGIITF